MKKIKLLALSGVIFCAGNFESASTTQIKCPDIETINDHLHCEQDNCVVAMGEWKGTAFGADKDLKITGLHPANFIARKPTCVYSTNQSGVILYLTLTLQDCSKSSDSSHDFSCP